MTDLTPEGLERIEGLAKAATPGPWSFIAGDSYCAYPSVHLGGKHFLIEDHCDSECNKERHESGGYPGKDEDAAFIAAANPETVLALVARVRELEKYERYWTNHEQSLASMKASCVDKCHCPPQYVCEYEDGTRHCLHCEAAKWWETEGQLEAVSSVAENLNARVVKQNGQIQTLEERVRELERGLEIIRDYGSHVEFINATLDGAKGGNVAS